MSFAVGGQTAFYFMKIRFDVMYNERFVKTFVYDNNKPFPPTEEELREYIIGKLPSYKNKDFKIEFYGESNVKR